MVNDIAHLQGFTFDYAFLWNLLEASIDFAISISMHGLYIALVMERNHFHSFFPLFIPHSTRILSVTIFCLKDTLLTIINRQAPKLLNTQLRKFPWKAKTKNEWLMTCRVFMIGKNPLEKRTIFYISYLLKRLAVNFWYRVINILIPRTGKMKNASVLEMQSNAVD